MASKMHEHQQRANERNVGLKRNTYDTQPIQDTNQTQEPQPTSFKKRLFIPHVFCAKRTPHHHHMDLAKRMAKNSFSDHVFLPRLVLVARDEEGLVRRRLGAGNVLAEVGLGVGLCACLQLGLGGFQVLGLALPHLEGGLLESAAVRERKRPGEGEGRGDRGRGCT